MTIENQPAFPGGWPEAGYEPCYGMTLRDWFAGQALAGMCAAPGGSIHAPEMARFSFVIADAMLTERAKEQGE